MHVVATAAVAMTTGETAAPTGAKRYQQKKWVILRTGLNPIEICEQSLDCDPIVPIVLLRN